MEKGYSLRQAAKRSGVPTMTFHSWKEKKLVGPDVADNKGNISLYSESMIARAKEIDAKRKAKKSADNSGNLFEGIAPPFDSVVNSEQSDGDLPVDYAATTADLSQNSEETLGQADEAVSPREKEKVDGAGSAIQEAIEVSAPVETAEPPMAIDLAPAADVVTLEDRANRIRQRQADVQRGIIEIGFELIAAKKEIGHGGWADWLKNEFGWTQQTANRFMRVAERFGKLNAGVQFKSSTLQEMLALPEGDETAFIEAQVAAGKPVENQSKREVRESVKQWNRQRNSVETTKLFSFKGTAASASLPALCEKIMRPDVCSAIHEAVDAATVDDVEALKHFRDALSKFAQELGGLILKAEIKIGSLLDDSAGDGSVSKPL